MATAPMDQLAVIPPRVAFLDPRTGDISRPWYMFIIGLYTRSGGAIAPTPNDLAADMPEDGGMEEIRAGLYRATDDLNQLPPVAALPDNDLDQTPSQEMLAVIDSLVSELSGLRERVGELTKEIQALQQGTMV